MRLSISWLVVVILAVCVLLSFSISVPILLNRNQELRKALTECSHRNEKLILRQKDTAPKAKMTLE